MAKLTAETKEKIVALWKAGKSQNSLALDFNVSPATINKLCKGIEQDNVELVNAQVDVIRAIYSKSEYEVNAIQFMVSDITEFERKSNARLQAIEDHAMSLLAGCERASDVKAIMDVAVKHRETRLGKKIDIATSEGGSRLPEVAFRIVDPLAIDAEVDGEF